MLLFYSLLALLGRIMLVAIFLVSAVGQHIMKFSESTTLMTAEGVPAPKILLGVAILFLLAGSLSVAAGFRARIGAALLLTFLLVTTYYFHDFWNFVDPAARQAQTIQFMKNLSMMGAMLLIVGNGAGTMSLDSRLRSRRASVMP